MFLLEDDKYINILGAAYSLKTLAGPLSSQPLHLLHLWELLDLLGSPRPQPSGHGDEGTASPACGMLPNFH